MTIVDVAVFVTLGFAMYGVMSFISWLMSLVSLRHRVNRATWQMYRLSPRLRNAVVIRALTLNRVRQGHEGITLVVAATDQCATAENLRSYEQVITAVQWMQGQAGEPEWKMRQLVDDYGARPSLAWPENFVAYSGPRGEYVDGQRV